jgi:hypothetical protein
MLRHKTAISAAFLCVVLLVSGYAVIRLLMILPASVHLVITIETSSSYIKVYNEHYQQVIRLDLGYHNPRVGSGIVLYIKNSHPNSTLYGVKVSSTLSNITDKVTEAWSEFPSTIDPGIWYPWVYYFHIKSDCPFGEYSWIVHID